jgi:hypothetical protein
MVDLLSWPFRCCERHGRSFPEFGAEDGNLRWGFDADPHATALCCQHGDDNVTADKQFFADFPSENEHENPPP